MLRVNQLTLDSINVLADDIERRLRRLEAKPTDEIDGYTTSYNEQTGKLKLIKGDKVVTFTKDA